ncbi:unnamed protein product [Penicillium nalgiovense]|nr:unnamed protein product [Penicillium nalgiovense]
MSKTRPATSGYARLAQAEEERGYLHDDSEDDDIGAFSVASTSAPRYAPVSSRAQMQASGLHSPPGHRRRHSGFHRGRRNSGVDIKAINARLEKWADEIASKFKINRVKGKSYEEEKLEIYHSVFQAPPGVNPVSAEALESDEFEGQQRRARAEYEEIIESVRLAIEMDVHPRMISQGSSGSYFARNPEGKVVGVFKPKDEEPYASRNPKWTKWIHRNLFPCFFGRACLIPNLSYVSEAAAYVLDARLRTNLVPYTGIVRLSSKSFFYDFWDRRKAWKGKKVLPPRLAVFKSSSRDLRTPTFSSENIPGLTRRTLDSALRTPRSARSDHGTRPVVHRGHSQTTRMTKIRGMCPRLPVRVTKVPSADSTGPRTSSNPSAKSWRNL